ncbi:MAG: FMN-binding negative transcriptional regulator [Acidiferrobacteraceae bacterium]
MPPLFCEERPDRLMEIVARYPFGLLISDASGEPLVSHVPMLVEQDRGSIVVLGHLARANPQCAALQSGGQMLAVFSGPDSYVSPSWYESPGVPTWNYVAVHLKGRARMIDDPPELRGVLERLTARFETEAGACSSSASLVERFEGLLPHIVGFALVADRVEGRFKLSQNRPWVDRVCVATALRGSGRSAAMELAAFMDRAREEAGGD